MKQIDNRQKQQILMRAQKAFLGGKNPALAKDNKEKEAKYRPSEKARPGEANEGGEKPASEQVAVASEHRTEPKVGRNDPCPCGSGKKYKKCCLH